MKPLYEEVDDLNNNDEFQGKIWSETVATPIGQMVVCATNKGICLLEFVNSDSPVPGLAALGKKLHGEVVSGENGHIWQVRQELADYFSGKRVKFDVPVHLIGTEFQKSV